MSHACCAINLYINLAMFGLLCVFVSVGMCDIEPLLLAKVKISTSNLAKTWETLAYRLILKIGHIGEGTHLYGSITQEHPCFLHFLLII